MEESVVGDIFQLKYWPGGNTKCMSWHVSMYSKIFEFFNPYFLILIFYLFIYSYPYSIST